MFETYNDFELAEYKYRVKYNTTDVVFLIRFHRNTN
jgi:hypothetical protein